MNFRNNRIVKFFISSSSTRHSYRHVFPVRGSPSQTPSPSSRRLRTYITQNQIMSADLQADRSLLLPSMVVSLAKAASPSQEAGSELLLPAFRFGQRY